MGLKEWLVGKAVDHEVSSAKKEGRMTALWRFLDGKKRLLGGALSALTVLGVALTQLTPIAATSLGAESKVVLYVSGAAGFLAWFGGVLHKAWKLYYHEEHAD